MRTPAPLGQPLFEGLINPCETCRDQPVPGVIVIDETAEGHRRTRKVQRCDFCERYPGDLDAARATQLVVGGRIYFRNGA